MRDLPSRQVLAAEGAAEHGGLDVLQLRLGQSRGHLHHLRPLRLHPLVPAAVAGFPCHKKRACRKNTERPLSERPVLTVALPGGSSAYPSSAFAASGGTSYFVESMSRNSTAMVRLTVTSWLSAFFIFDSMKTSYLVTAPSPLTQTLAVPVGLGRDRSPPAAPRFIWARFLAASSVSSPAKHRPLSESSRLTSLKLELLRSPRTSCGPRSMPSDCAPLAARSGRFQASPSFTTTASPFL